MIHSYPWYPADWLQCEDRFAFSLSERGLYRDLTDICYKDGSLPSDLEQLRLMAGCTRADFTAAWKKVQVKFLLQDGRLYNAKVTEIRDRLLLWHESKQKAGRRGGIAKAQLQQTSSSAKAQLWPTTTTTTTTQYSDACADPAMFIETLRPVWPANRLTTDEMIGSALVEVFGVHPITEEKLELILANAKLYVASDEVQRGVCMRVDRWIKGGTALGNLVPAPKSEPIDYQAQMDDYRRRMRGDETAV